MSTNIYQTLEKVVQQTTVAPLPPDKAPVLILYKRKRTRIRAKLYIPNQAIPYYSALYAALGEIINSNIPPKYVNVTKGAGVPSAPVITKETTLTEQQLQQLEQEKKTVEVLLNQAIPTTQQQLEKENKTVEFLYSIFFSSNTLTRLNNPYPEYAVKGVLIYNPPGNTNPILVNNIQIPPGNAFQITAEGAELNVNSILVNTKGQQIVILFMFVNTTISSGAG